MTNLKAAKHDIHTPNMQAKLPEELQQKGRGSNEIAFRMHSCNWETIYARYWVLEIQAN